MSRSIPASQFLKTRNIFTTVRDKWKRLYSYRPAGIHFSLSSVMQNISLSIHLWRRRKLPLRSKNQTRQRKWLRRRYRGAGRSGGSAVSERVDRPKPSARNGCNDGSNLGE